VCPETTLLVPAVVVASGRTGDDLAALLMYFDVET
jgi:hypothetical protein